MRVSSAIPSVVVDSIACSRGIIPVLVLKGVVDSSVRESEGSAKAL